ncbi:MAG: hypothetical protein KKA16_05015 [Alphaproteobacteria bacterium]|nr:hypothetical protein [Alphaproteobacteria bacterium]MBU2377614.1 hypothetical protein [Alphaproteobacteria bacterium]
MIRGLVLAVGLALAGTAAAQERPWTPLPDPVSATCPGGLCQPQALDVFFRSLDRRDRPVRIVQFGDSHTAGGDITRSLLWRLEARFGGTAFQMTTHGVVGATLNGLAERAPLLDAGEETPDLIIVAYGTNEGFDELLSPAAYEARLRGQIERLRSAAPGADILLLGPPEAMRGDGGGHCADDPERRWKAPALLGVVRDVQQRVAAELGVAFWDWKGRMGGDCSAHALTLGEAPLMRGDHIHFTFAGGDWIGSLLAADIIGAYGRRGGR